MNKIGLILAGAVVFDLGVVVASGYAAVDSFLKIDPAERHAALKIKLDKVGDVEVCKAHDGTVSTVGGVQYCDIPASQGAHTPAHSGY